MAVTQPAAGEYDDDLHDLRRELLEPPEFVLRDELVQPLRPGRGPVTGDGVTDWLQCVGSAFAAGGGHGRDGGERRRLD